jgi:hypothetical protein
MDAGAQIYIPAGPIDLQTETGYVQATVNNLLAGLEKRRIRERTTRAKEEMRRQGKLASGKPPYGLAYSKGAGWSYTPEIEHVREIFALYLSGEERTFARIGERFGLRWERVKDMLVHPVYSGWLVWERPDGAIRVPLGLTPVVGEADFAEVQRLIGLRSSRISLARQASESRFLFRGMLFCPCGAPLYGYRKPGRRSPWLAYGCRSLKESGQRDPYAGHMAAHKLEALLGRLITEQLTDPAFIAAAVEAFNRSASAEWRDALPQPEANARRVGELERRRERILETFYDGKITREERDRAVGPLDVQLEALRSYQLPAPARPAELDAGDVLGVLSVFAEWEYLERDEQREVLEALAPSIEVAKRYDVRGMHVDLPVPGPGDSRRGLVVASRIWLPLGVRAA